MIATRTVLLATLPLLATGCDLIDQGREIFDGLTNPLVAQTIVLGVQLPDDAGDIEFPDEFADGVAASVFLADAADVADLENAPIGDAEVTLQGETVGETQPGAYLMEPGSLTYTANATWDITIAVGDGTATAEVDLPPPANFSPPMQHSANTPLSVDMTGQDFDGALLVVVDQDGTITFDNRPADIRDVYNLARGGDPPTVVEIPGTAFPSAGAYAVGVAGVRSTNGADRMDSMNTVLSSAMAGQLVFRPLAVMP